MERQFTNTATAFCMLSAALITISCNGNGKNSNKGEANESDTIVQNALAAKTDDATWEKDSIAKAHMTSPDFVYYQLHGPVKYMKKGDIYFHFNEEGELISLNGYNPFIGDCYQEGMYNSRITFTRDTHNYIRSEAGWEWDSEYTWKDGKKVHESMQAEADVYEYDYTYDDNGDLIKVEGYTYTCGNEDERTPEKRVYTIKKRDAYGNWTEGEEKDLNLNYTDKYSRSIIYYPIVRPGTKVAKPDFNPEEETYTFNATIGGEKNCKAKIGPDGGYYQLASGKRELKIGYYDPADGTLCLFAYLGGKDYPIGVFEGKVTDGQYKGVFTNNRNNGNVDFKMSIE